MNSKMLSYIDQEVENHLPQIRSVLIVRHGYLVFERYYQGYDQNSFHETQSVGKSFESALVGISIQEGYLEGIDQKMIDFFPEYVTPDLDPQVKEITLEHILTMTSGYPYCADCIPGPGEDPVEYTLYQPLTAPPGQKFQYTNNTVNYLLVEILTRATHMDILEFANNTLCVPLGITASCEQLAKNHTFKPRDMAKFGYLYLNNGMWDEKQIVPAEWVKTSTQRQNANTATRGERYGYLFWVTTVSGYSAYYAEGHGGQFIFVVPELDIVVVITSNLDRHHAENSTLVGSFIIPAVMK
jgi:CubicO group peptidase (beta-lactamase class C family)